MLRLLTCGWRACLNVVSSVLDLYQEANYVGQGDCYAINGDNGVHGRAFQLVLERGASVFFFLCSRFRRDVNNLPCDLQGFVPESECPLHLLVIAMFRNYLITVLFDLAVSRSEWVVVDRVLYY